MNECLAAKIPGATALLAALVCLIALVGRADAQSALSTDQVKAEMAANHAIAAGYVLSVKSFGATANNTLVRAKATAGSTTVVVDNNSGLAPGQNVVLIHAGAPALLKAPTAFSATAITYDEYNVVDRPGCTVHPAYGLNPNCSTPWSFQVEAVDDRGGISASTQRSVVSAGPARPSPTDRIKLVWDSTAEATGYMVYGCSGAGCTPALVAVLPNTWFTDANASPCAGCPRPLKMVFWYMGSDLQNRSASVPTRDFGSDQQLGTRLSPTGAKQDLFTDIKSINGNSLTLAAAPQISGDVQMNHDDSPAFQAAIDKARALGDGASIFIPTGQYPLAQTLSFEATYGLHIFGAGVAASILVWHGAPGGTVLNLNQARDSIYENFGINNIPNAPTPGVAVDIDKYDAGRGIKLIATHDTLADLIIGASGIGIRLGNRSSGNCEMMTFRNVNISPYYGGWCGYYMAGKANTLDEEITGGSVGPRSIALFLNGAGSVDSYVLNLNNNQIDWYLNNVTFFSHLIEKGSDSEHAAEHLYLPVRTLTPLRISMSDSRFYDYPQTVAANGFYIVNNSSRGLALTGNDVCAQNTTGCKIFFLSGSPQVPAELLSVNNRYGTLHPFATAPGVKVALMSVLDHGCRNEQGEGRPCQPQLISQPVNPALSQLLLSHMGR